MFKLLIIYLLINMFSLVFGRNSQKYAANQSLSIVYQSKVSRLIRKIITHDKWFSALAGAYFNLSISKFHIASFVKKYSIAMNESEKKINEFINFNDFFTRKLKPQARPIDCDPTHIISPADGKILVIENIQEQSQFPVKNITFSLESFLKDKTLAQKYLGGSLILIRLDPWDYHRFHIPIDGYVQKAIPINGSYESVNPIVYQNNIQVLSENERHLIAIKTDMLDEVIMVNIGALCVGKITETYNPNHWYKKGDELGYFSFGGSTIVLLFKKNLITIHPEIVNNSLMCIESLTQMGKSLATINTLRNTNN